MTALQKINQGTAPAGSDGDTVRSAFSKVNSNVDVLNTQAALTSSAVITAAQALTNAHVGKRVSINLATAGVINMPAAATCAADNVILLRNVGTTIATLAITTGSGDTVSLSKLNPGETALMDTDGVHAWNVLMRGRTNSDNEVVNFNLSVGGSLTVGGVPASPPGSMVAYTPSVSASIGGYGTGLSSSGAYFKFGKLVFFQVQILIPNAGNAVGPIVGLPVPAYASALQQVVTGREVAIAGKSLTGTIASGGSTMTVFNYDNSNPVANGVALVLSGCYYAA
ncbi:hypothetical protein [Burkholderia vietnamiensis]|uniref:hypothetical protein n=1 Tax=Burkholderia vietnamiensis TaxID=60552 RepID=UPI001B8F0DEF|nr:hypothetical protein [Burkholderia vietnamiensis]MBR8219937.1 hypothetical protein [Burkholderia vietnamiensis]